MAEPVASADGSSYESVEAADLQPLVRWRRRATRRNAAAIALLIAAQVALFTFVDDGVAVLAGQVAIVAAAFGCRWYHARAYFALAMSQLGARVAGQRVEPRALSICDRQGREIDVGLVILDDARQTVRVESLGTRYLIRRGDGVRMGDESVSTRASSVRVHLLRYRAGDDEQILVARQRPFADGLWHAIRATLGPIRKPADRRGLPGTDFREDGVAASASLTGAAVSWCTRVVGASLRAPGRLRVGFNVALVAVCFLYIAGTAWLGVVADDPDTMLGSLVFTSGEAALLVTAVLACVGLLRAWRWAVVRGVRERLPRDARGYVISIEDPTERVRTVEDVGVAMPSKLRSCVRIEGWTHRYEIRAADVIAAELVWIARPLFRGSTRALFIHYRIDDRELELAIVASTGGTGLYGDVAAALGRAL